MDTQHALKPGTVIASPAHAYTIQSVLGQGGFGITYSATYAEVFNGEVVIVFAAIKEHFISSLSQRDDMTGMVISSAPVAERVASSLRDFTSEARRLQSIAGVNENIVAVRDVFEANGTAYYVMEHLGGINLREYVRAKQKLTLDEAYSLLRPIISALAILHSRRITHLDIKPANIMIASRPDGSPRPVLIDFGLSKHYKDDGSATSTINTQGFTDGYAPLEQYAGITKFSPSSDVYSLMACMLFCITGVTPPKATELADSTALARVMPGSLTPRVRQAAMHAMQSGRRARTPDGAAFLAEMDAAMAKSQEGGARRRVLTAWFKKNFSKKGHAPSRVVRMVRITVAVVICLAVIGVVGVRLVKRHSYVYKVHSFAYRFDDGETLYYLQDDDYNVVLCTKEGGETELQPWAVGTWTGDIGNGMMYFYASTAGNRQNVLFSKGNSYQISMSGNEKATNVTTTLNGSKPHLDLASVMNGEQRFSESREFELSTKLVGTQWYHDDSSGKVWLEFVDRYCVKIHEKGKVVACNYILMSDGTMVLGYDGSSFVSSRLSNYDKGSHMYLKISDKTESFTRR